MDQKLRFFNNRETQIIQEPTKPATSNMKQTTLLVFCALTQAVFAHIDEFLQGGVDNLNMMPPPLDDRHADAPVNATIAFQNIAALSNVGGEPASCKQELKHLCGHCGGSKHCWVQCAKEHKQQLIDAGCHRMSSAVDDDVDDVEAAVNGDEPPSCTKELKHLCGHCETSKSCWLSCAKKHEGQLMKAGCKRPSSSVQKTEKKKKSLRGKFSRAFLSDVLSVCSVCQEVVKGLVAAGAGAGCGAACAASGCEPCVPFCASICAEIAGGETNERAICSDIDLCAKSNVGGEPASCKRELKQLCGHCGTSKSCWLSCAKEHEGQLMKAGCKRPSVDTKKAVPLVLKIQDAFVQ
mgnify:CR=1 FL=1